MTVAKHLIDNLNGGTPYQKEALRIFYLIVTVSHTLIVGQNKSARPNLRLLHQAIQQFAAMDEGEESVMIVMSEVPEDLLIRGFYV